MNPGRKWVEFFLKPNGVAVVGATREPDSGGYHLLTNLTLSYKGSIYPVNSKYEEVLGLKCYPRVSDIQGPLDLALIFVPARAVPQVLEDCVQKGVRGAILESGGFAEVGPEGKALQDQCLAIARKGGMRLWGPNCMGLIDTSTGHVFSFIATDAWQGVVNPGGVSLIVQSGLLSAGFITTLMGNKTLRLAKVFSIGNKCDVEETELLEILLKDRATRVIGLYLESFIQGHRFFELASSSDKPIVLLKGGRTASGAQASASHTASLAGNDELTRGVLRQGGVHQAEDFFEMTDMVRALEKDFHPRKPLGEKPRIAVLSYSGASGIVTADHMETYGLALATLSPQTQRSLEELSPAWMPISNPVDYWPAMEKQGPVLAYKHALKVLHDAPEVDGLIVHLFAGFGAWFLDMKEIMSVVKAPWKPILFWLMGPEKGREPTRLTLEEEGWPAFAEIHRTVRVMGCLFENRKERSERLTSPPSGFQIPSTLKDLVLQAEEKKLNILDEHEAKKWFQALDLPVVKEILVNDPEEATRAACETGYPVVLKGISGGKIHKTEAGYVRLNLWTSDHLRSAFQQMLSLKAKPQSFLIQPMLTADLELMVGVTRDPQFGPAIMLGLGGIHAEVYRDVIFRLPPLDQDGVSEMVSELKGRALLQGYRGSKPVNMQSLASWLIKLGGLAMMFDRINAIDVNPLLIIHGEPVAVDATIVLRSDFQTGGHIF